MAELTKLKDLGIVGTELSGSFAFDSPNPIDLREVVPDIATLEGLKTVNNVYPGMIVYVKSENKHYKYVKPEEGDGEWKVLTPYMHEIAQENGVSIVFDGGDANGCPTTSMGGGSSSSGGNGTGSVDFSALTSTLTENSIPFWNGESFSPLIDLKTYADGIQVYLGEGNNSVPGQRLSLQRNQVYLQDKNETLTDPRRASMTARGGFVLDNFAKRVTYGYDSIDVTPSNIPTNAAGFDNYNPNKMLRFSWPSKSGHLALNEDLTAVSEQISTVDTRLTGLNAIVTDAMTNVGIAIGEANDALNIANNASLTATNALNKADATQNSLDTKYQELTNTLKNHYTKTEVDNKVAVVDGNMATINSTITSLSNNFNNYSLKDSVYTKAETYTKTEVDNKLSSAATSGIPQEPGWTVTSYALNRDYGINGVLFKYSAIKYTNNADSSKSKIVFDIYTSTPLTAEADPIDEFGVSLGKWSTGAFAISLHQLVNNTQINGTALGNIQTYKYIYPESCAWAVDPQTNGFQFSDSGFVIPQVANAIKDNGQATIWGLGIRFNSYNLNNDLKIAGQRIKVTLTNFSSFS